MLPLMSNFKTKLEGTSYERRTRTTLAQRIVHKMWSKVACALKGL